VSLAAYVAHRASLFSDRLVTELGLRWDRQTYTGGRQWSPRLNVSWHPTLRSELRVGAGAYSQSQRINELRVEDGQTTYDPAEVSRQVDVAFTQQIVRDVSVRVDAYLNKISSVQPRHENLLSPVELFPDAEPDRVLVSPESADLRGIEITLSGAHGGFEWSASYARADAREIVEGVDVPRSWDQPHAGKLLVAYRWRRGFFVSATGVMHTGWPTTPVSGRVVELPDGSTEIEPVIGARNSQRLPTYARFDAIFGYARPIRKGAFRIQLQVVNLADRENPCCVDEDTFVVLPNAAVETHRTYDYWLGLTPSLSALWTF
jgi:outer membrane receptor protein involved in Fe transport